MIPLLVLLMDRTFVSGTFSQSLRKRPMLYAGLFAVWILTIALIVFGPRGDSVGFHSETLTPWTYLLTQSGVIVHYLRLSIWPWPLVVDYHDWPRAASIASVWPAAALVLAILCAAFAGVFLTRDRWRRALGFAGAWFFIILAPSSSILPLTTEIAAERRMYLPLIALLAIAVLAAHVLVSKIRSTDVRRFVGAALWIVPLTALTFATINRNRDYRSAFSLWQQTVTHRPNNARARINLAEAILAIDPRRLDDAIGEYRRALEAEPTYSLAHANIALLLMKKGRSAETLQHARLAVKYGTQHAVSHRSLGMALGATGRSREAETELRMAIDINPNDADAWMMLAQALLDQGRRTESDEAMRKSQSLARPK